MAEKQKKSHKWLKISGIIAAVLVLLALVSPLPLYAETPGEADNLAGYIKVDGKKIGRAHV